MSIIKYGFIGILLGLIISFSIPKEYITKVRLAAEEGSTLENFGNISEIASLAGFEFGKSKEGISPDLYPEVIASTPFLISFVDLQVKPKLLNGDSIAFYDYILKEQKAAWWNYVFQFPYLIIDKFSKSKTDNKVSSRLDFYRPNKDQIKFLEKFVNRIDVIISKKNGIITLTVKMQDAEISALIANKLVEKLQEYMTNYKTTKSRYDMEYVRTLYEEAKKKYYLAQTTYAQAIDNNHNIISASSKTKLDLLLNEQNLAFGIYNNLAQKLELAKAKVQNDTPVITVIEPPSIPIKSASPKKVAIIIICGLLSCLISSGIIIFSFLGKDNLN